KKGWFNRNRILEAGHYRLFTIPLKKDSDYLRVDQRYLSDTSADEIARMLRIIETNYKKAPHFDAAYPTILECFAYTDKNLFGFLYHSIQIICGYLGILTDLAVASKISDNASLKAEQKVLAICKAEGATTYINAIGGMDLYDKALFRSEGIELQFIKSKDVEYQQFDRPFVPGLSIVDIMMFNDRATIKQMLGRYDLV
ncbi:MAG: WbqC family protein, partial [Nitrososphaerales archaeon]